MDITKLSTKGQIILPKNIRDARSWEPGTEFTIEESDDGIFLRPVQEIPEFTLEEVAGFLAYKGKHKTDAEIEKGIEREILRRHDSGRY